MLSLALLTACAPKEKVDCDQLMTDQKYKQVVNSCDDPAQVSMAYLGLAGFDFVKFLAADDPDNTIELLDVKPGNVTSKRNLVLQAVRGVAKQDTSIQSFVLLLASYLGLKLTLAEYLDNGAADADALDNQVLESEVEDATGLHVVDPAPAVPFALGASPTYAVVESGDPYVVDCGADVTAPLCDGSDPVTVYDDTAPSLGAGLDVTGADGSPPALAGAEAADQVVMLLDFDPPITLDTGKLDRAESFLGTGTLDPNFPKEHPGLFPIGVLGYLDLIERANSALVKAAGGKPKKGESPQSTLNDQINKIRERLDNGAACFKEGATDPAKTAAAIPLNILYAIYLSAAGTAAQAAPSDGDYTAFNIVSAADLDIDGDLATDDPSGTAVPDGSQFEFGGGGLSMGYKVLFPKSAGLSTFNRAQATPRVDTSHSAFRNAFELLPRIAPNAVEAGDGKVDLIEVICTAEDS